MFFRKFKALIYIIILLFILSFLAPLISFAFDEDSIYVWSNNSSEITTSIFPSATEQKLNSTIQDSSRKFFKYHIW